MVIPRFVTDRSDSVFLCCVCFEHRVKKGKNLLCSYTQSCTCTNKWDPLSCHDTSVLHTPSSEQCQWDDTYRFHWLAEAFLSSFVTRSLSSSALLSSLWWGRICWHPTDVCYPEKRRTPPSHREKGVLNYIFLQLRMCCGCNVTQTINGYRKKYRVMGNYVWATCTSCISVKDEATFYKDNRFVLFEKAIIWKAWPDLQE